MPTPPYGAANAPVGNTALNIVLLLLPVLSVPVLKIDVPLTAMVPLANKAVTCVLP